ncbi:MAG: ABC transporter permease [Lachnospiraceae bacterium]|nr:ABC transporter permease [Lachnospiraceae bacterium]
MQNKLAVRNAMRSMKDYVIYMITMGLIAALMFAFNSMLFSDMVGRIVQDIGIMAAMISLVTFVIVLIVAWLINYMVRFMLEKRSREFGTYLLLGMKKKQIAWMYMKENVILGTISFLAGCLFGCFLQQIIMAVFYSIFDMQYEIKIAVSGWGVLMTVGCYYACYGIALIRNRRKFKRMSIRDLMQMEKQNEQVKEGKDGIRQFLMAGSILYILFFTAFIFRGTYTPLRMILGFAGFIAAVYLFYVGFSSFIVRLIKNRHNIIYKNEHLFLLRNLSSKLKTMQFTMGTLTVLFTVALLSGTIAMMFSNYQKQHLDSEFPFDVIVYSPDAYDDFSMEQEAVKKDNTVEETRIYQIYENKTSKMNEYLYTHLAVIGTEYKNKDGSTDYEKIQKKGWQYNTYDTYMKLSDYNALREMIGLSAVTLQDDEYLIHIKEKLEKDLGEDIKRRKIETESGTLHLSQIKTEEFSQSGHNGADYVIVIPDQAAAGMTPMYSVMAMDLEGHASDDLMERLTKIHRINHPTFTEDEDVEEDSMTAYGSDQILVFASDVIVSENANVEMKYVLTSVVFPLIYINIVFLCVALTILAVQQLSDSNKYAFRYGILRKLGLKERERNRLILKQLILFYLCPALIAVFLSIAIALFASGRFILYTGVSTSVFFYYGVSLAIFLGTYLLYFIATYIGFVRNVSAE